MTYSPAPNTHPPRHPGPAPGGTALPPQSWAYPTVDGLQLVQAGAPQLPVHGAMPAHSAQPVPVEEPLRALGGAVATRRRIRWETIIPGTALACVTCAMTLFLTDTDRFMGARDQAQAPASATTKEPAAAAPVVVPRSTKLNPAAARRVTALRARLVKERSGGRWAASISTIDALQKMVPATPLMKRQRAQAAAKVRSARTARATRIVARVRALISAGRYSEASKSIAAGAPTITPAQQRQLRAALSSAKRASAAKAAAATKARQAAQAAAARSASSTTGGGRSAAATAPAPPAASVPPSTAPTTPRPPANVGAGSLPPRPDAPNPITTPPTTPGAVSGQPPTTG